MESSGRLTRADSPLEEASRRSGGEDEERLFGVSEKLYLTASTRPGVHDIPRVDVSDLMDTNQSNHI